MSWNVEVLLVLVVGVLLPDEVHACRCTPRPSRGFLSATGATIPTQAAGVLFFTKKGQLPDIRFSSTVAPPHIPLKVTSLDVIGDYEVFIAHLPRGMKEEERRYKFKATTGMRRAIFLEPKIIRGSAKALGLLVSRPRTTHRSMAAWGVCERSIRVARVYVDVQLPAPFNRARAGLYYRILLDGKRWITWDNYCLPPQLQGAGSGFFEIIASCADKPRSLWRGTTLGEHVVRVEVVHPDGQFPTTTATATFNLKCNAPI